MVKSIDLIEGGHCGIQPSYAYICGDHMTVKNSKRNSLTVLMKTTNPPPHITNAGMSLQYRRLKSGATELSVFEHHQMSGRVRRPNDFVSS